MHIGVTAFKNQSIRAYIYRVVQKNLNPNFAVVIFFLNRTAVLSASLLASHTCTVEYN